MVYSKPQRNEKEKTLVDTDYVETFYLITSYRQSGSTTTT